MAQSTKTTRKTKPQKLINFGVSQVGDKYGWIFITELKNGSHMYSIEGFAIGGPCTLIYYGKHPEKVKIEQYKSYEVLVKVGELYNGIPQFEIVKQKLNGKYQPVHFKKVDKIEESPAAKVDFIKFEFDHYAFARDLIETVSYGARFQGVRTKPRGNNVRCSSAGKCHRFQFLDTYFQYLDDYDRQKIIEQIKKDMEFNLGAFQPGTAAHNDFETNLLTASQRKYGPVELISHEKTVKGTFGEKIKFELKGHFDLMLRWNNQTYIADIKTADSKWFDKMASNQAKIQSRLENCFAKLLSGQKSKTKFDYQYLNQMLDFTLLKIDHILQIQCYLKLLGESHGLIIYLNKKNYAAHTIYVPFIQSIFDYVVRDFEILLEAKQSNRIPPPLFEGKVDYPCKKGTYTCKYFYYCYEKDPTRKLSEDEFEMLGGMAK